MLPAIFELLVLADGAEPTFYRLDANGWHAIPATLRFVRGRAVPVPDLARSVHLRPAAVPIGVKRAYARHFAQRSQP